MSNYKNLPGVNINVKDGQMLITDDNTTNSMLIIGEAKAGKGVTIPEEPILVRTEEELYESFGRYFSQGELNPVAAEWKIAKDANIQNTYILALKGETQKERLVYLQDMMFNTIPDYQFSHIILTGMYADESIHGLLPEDFGVETLDNIQGIEVYETVKGEAAPKKLTLTSGESAEFTIKINEQQATATLTESYKDPRKLVKDLTLGLKKAISELGIELDVVIDVVDNIVYLKTSEKVTYEGTKVLEALSINSVIPEPIKEGVGNAGVLLGKFAEKQTLESEAVIVYIATKPVTTTNKKEIKEKITDLKLRRNEISKNVQVIAGPEVGVTIPGSLRTQWVSGITNYAVLINSLAVQNAPTNQPLPGINGLRYNLSLRQLDELVGNKYVTFRSKNNRIIVVDGVTSAPDIFKGQDVVHSDFRRLTTLRSTGYMVNGIRAVLDPFIGRPNDFPSYNAMNTAIRGFINKAIDRGVIQDAVYSIDMGNSLDVANINLTILPQFELRKIDVQIGLSTPQGFEAISQ